MQWGFCKNDRSLYVEFLPVTAWYNQNLYENDICPFAHLGVTRRAQAVAPTAKNVPASLDTGIFITSAARVSSMVTNRLHPV